MLLRKLASSDTLFAVVTAGLIGHCYDVNPDTFELKVHNIQTTSAETKRTKQSDTEAGMMRVANSKTKKKKRIPK